MKTNEFDCVVIGGGHLPGELLRLRRTRLGGGRAVAGLDCLQFQALKVHNVRVDGKPFRASLLKRVVIHNLSITLTMQQTDLI